MSLGNQGKIRKTGYSCHFFFYMPSEHFEFATEFSTNNTNNYGQPVKMQEKDLRKVHIKAYFKYNVTLQIKCDNTT